MFKCVRNIICLFVLSWLGFILLSAWSGGEKIREAGDKAEGILQKGAYALADKADGIKQTVDGITDKVKKWSGKGGDPDGSVPENGSGSKKKNRRKTDE